VAAVRITRLAGGDGTPSPAPTVGGPAPVADLPLTEGGPTALASSTEEAAP
jgi:hypothetical protein